VRYAQFRYWTKKVLKTKKIKTPPEKRLSGAFFLCQNNVDEFAKKILADNDGLIADWSKNVHVGQKLSRGPVILEAGGGVIYIKTYGVRWPTNNPNNNPGVFALPGLNYANTGHIPAIQNGRFVPTPNNDRVIGMNLSRNKTWGHTTDCR
jgi:hypothetical protein